MKKYIVRYFFLSIPILLVVAATSFSEEEKGWYSFQIPPLENKVNAVHIGQLVLDAPAGRHGFCQVKGDHFVFTDGTRARFWGTNITFDAACPSKELAPQIAQRLAKLGCNIVRFHSIDHKRALLKEPRGAKELNSEMLDRLDFFINELKKQGIYYEFSLHNAVVFTSALGFPEGDRTPPLGKIIALFYPKAIEVEQTYARRLLTHKNPYTGLRYADDPALALVEMLNENSLWGAWAGGGLNKPPQERSKKAIPQHYIDWLDQDFNQWLIKKYGNRERLKKAWQADGIGLTDKEDPTQGSARRIYGKQLKEAGKKRVEDMVRYYYDLEVRFYTMMKDFLRKELGVKVPITANHHYPGMPGLAARDVLDYIDTHGYWDHPDFEGGNQNNPHFRAHFLSYVANPMYQPQTRMPDEAAPIPRYNSPRVEGKPMTVSEWNISAMNPFAYELPLIAAGYGSFHDFDGLFSFVFANSEEVYSPSTLTYTFQIINNPQAQILQALGALLFHRQDVRPGEQVISLAYSEEDIFSDILKQSSKENFLWWGKKVPDWISYVTGIRRKIMTQGKDSGPLQLLDQKDTGRYETLTKELIWDVRRPGDEYAAINTDRFQAVIGSLKDKKDILKNIDIDGETQAVVALVSLKKEPLSQTNHALLVTMGRQRGKGEEVTEEGPWLRWNPGEQPFQLETVRVTIILKNLDTSKKIHLYALDPQGERKEEVPLKEKLNKGAIGFQLGTYNSPWYELTSQ